MASQTQELLNEVGQLNAMSVGRGTCSERKLSHLKTLEAESIPILRQAAAEFSRPVMLYSIGKDSSVMLRLAQKARIERALFEIGFEVMLIDKNEARSASARAAWAALHAAGFVVVYHNPKLGSEERAELRAAAGDRFFDLAEIKLLAGDAGTLEHVLSFTKSLRISGEDGNPGKVI